MFRHDVCRKAQTMVHRFALAHVYTHIYVHIDIYIDVCMCTYTPYIHLRKYAPCTFVHVQELTSHTHMYIHSHMET